MSWAARNNMYPHEVFPDGSPAPLRGDLPEFLERASNYAESSASGAARRPRSRSPPHYQDSRRASRNYYGDPYSVTSSRRVPCKFFDFPSGRPKAQLDGRHSMTTCRFMHPGDSEWTSQAAPLPYNSPPRNVRTLSTSSAMDAPVRSFRDSDDPYRRDWGRRRSASPSRRSLDSDRRDRDYPPSNRNSAAKNSICRFYDFPSGSLVTPGVKCTNWETCRDVHPQDPEWCRRLDERRGRPAGTTKPIKHKPVLQRNDSACSPSKGRGSSIPRSEGKPGGRPPYSRENSHSRPMTPMAVSQLPPISTQRSPSAPPPPPADGPLPPPTPQSSLSGPLRTSQPSSPSRLSQIPQLNGKEQTSAGQPETTRRVREKRKAALAKFTEVLQAVLIAHTKLNIAQNVVKRAGPIYTSTDTHYDEDLIRDLYQDESNAKAELKTAHDDFEAVYDTLVYNNAFDESADDVLAALDQRLGIAEHQQKMVNLERAASTTEDAIGALQMRANTLQAAVDAIPAKLDAGSANEAPRVNTDQVIAIVTAEFAKRQADVVMREPDPPVKQSQSVPPSPLPSPPASAQANGTITHPPMEDSKRGRARQMLQDLVDRVDILEIEQSISTAQIDELEDTVSDFMSDCASVTRSVLRKMMRGDGTDQSRETLAAELRKIIRLVNGEDSVAPATRPVQSDELAAAPNSSSAVADAEGLKSEVKASLKAEIKAELMAELKAQIKAELKEETKAEIRAEVQHEYHTMITELQEKVEFLETGMSSQISSMYQEFREYRNSSK